MVLETTYTDKEVTKAINDAVGQPFDFLTRIKMGGIGSHRIQINRVSKGLESYINPGHSTNHVNLELRPLGIIVHLKWRTQTYAWVIPISKLEMSLQYDNISDGTESIDLLNSMEYNESFFKKLEKQKMVIK